MTTRLEKKPANINKKKKITVWYIHVKRRRLQKITCKPMSLLLVISYFSSWHQRSSCIYFLIINPMHRQLTFSNQQTLITSTLVCDINRCCFLCALCSASAGGFPWKTHTIHQISANCRPHVWTLTLCGHQQRVSPAVCRTSTGLSGGRALWVHSLFPCLARFYMVR